MPQAGVPVDPELNHPYGVIVNVMSPGLHFPLSPQMTNVSQPIAGQVGEIECVLIDSSAKAAYVFLWLRTFFWLFVWVVSESVWHHYWQGSLRLISASVFLFICVHWAMFKAALDLDYTCSRRCAKQLRWFWRGRGRCRGGCIVKIGRISRPDQSKKARRRGGGRRKGRAEEPRNIPEEHRSRARPVLETDVLPPPRSQENITVLVCVLFAMNPAIFASCWEDLWQPFICLCIFERTCIAIGLFCLCWTVTATKAIDMGIK